MVGTAVPVYPTSGIKSGADTHPPVYERGERKPPAL